MKFYKFALHFAFVSFVLLLNMKAGKAQKVRKADPFIFKTDYNYNRLSLYSPHNNSIAVFEKDVFWYADLSGKRTSPDVSLIKKGIDAWHPTLSPSGKNIFFYRPNEDFLKGNIVEIFNVDSGRSTAGATLNVLNELKDVHFLNDSLVMYKGGNDDPADYVDFYLEKGKVNYLIRDSAGNGALDITMYEDKICFILKNKDSLYLMAGDTGKTMNINFAIKIPAGKNVVNAFFSEGYPFVFVQNKIAKTTEVYSLSHTTFILQKTIKGLPFIIEKKATANACYIITADDLEINSAIYFEELLSGNRLKLDGYSVQKEQPIFSIHPSENFFTVSHPYSGFIQANNLKDGKLIWEINPEHSFKTYFSKTFDTSNLGQNTLTVQMKQGTANTIKNFYDDTKDEIIQVQQNKILFTDAESNGRKKMLDFLPGDQPYDFVISPDKKMIAYSLMRAKEESEKDLFRFPDAKQVYSLDSGKVMLTIESSVGMPDIKFLNNNLLYIENSKDEKNNRASFFLYDLKSHTKKITAALKGYEYLSDIVYHQNKIFFTAYNDKQAVLQTDDGKTIFKWTGKYAGAKKPAFFSEGIPYLFVTQDVNNNSALCYRITADTIKLLRKAPGSNVVIAMKGTDSSCYILYKKTVQRKGDEFTHNRLFDAVTGKDRLVDSVNSYSDDVRIIPATNFLVEEGSMVSWFDLNTGFEFRKVTDESKVISSIAYSPDGRYLAAANPRGKVMLWDLGTGKETRVLNVDKAGYITRLAFSGNGAYLGASSGDIWETATGKNVVSVTDPGIWDVNSIDYSTDGKKIVSGGAATILWDGETGEKLKFYQYPDSTAFDKINECWKPQGCIRDDYELMVFSTAFHPDSKHFVTGNATGYVILYNADSTGMISYKNYRTYGQRDRKIYDIKYTRNGESILMLQHKCLYKLNSQTLAVQDSFLIPVNEKILSIDIGYDNKVFSCINNKDNKQVVEIRSIENLNIIKEFVAPGADFNKISFSPNKIHAATASDDGFCTIWNIETGKPVIYLNNIGDYGNVMVTPDNYYMASKSALTGVTFKKGNEFYSFDQFDLILNRPDIVLERLGYASKDLINFYQQAFYKRLKKSTNSTEQPTLNFAIPLLEISNKTSIPYVTQTKSQILQLNIADNANANGKVEITINGNKVFEQSIEANKSGDTTRVNADIIPSQGANNIEAIYTNNEGAESHKQKLSVSYLPAKPEPSKVWYIGVGVSNYDDSSMNLRYAVKDIKDIATAIRKKYPTAIIDTLLNSSVTKENLATLKQKLKSTSINDKVIVSYSGHGLVSDSLDWYFATWDVDFKKPQQRGLSYNDMEGILEGIPARQKLLLVDACHSGELDKESDKTFANKETALENNVKEEEVKGARSNIKSSTKIGLQSSFELMQELFANLQKGNGTSVVSAAGGREYAFESEQWKNGVFTYSLLNALKDKSTDENEDGQITIKELKKVVFDSVKKLTGGRQKPTSRVEASDGWVIWNN